VTAVHSAASAAVAQDLDELGVAPVAAMGGDPDRLAALAR
jgi:hypothetical protein